MARQRASLNEAIIQGKTEVAAYEKELSNIGEQRRLREIMLEKVKSLSERGLTTQQRLTDSQILLSSVDRDAQYAIANIARGRQSLDRATRDLAMLALERRVALDKELQTIDEQLAKHQVTIDAGQSS
jgi:polysaccharide export outer membrane protein